jgi:hypothetical protein
MVKQKKSGNGATYVCVPFCTGISSDSPSWLLPDVSRRRTVSIHSLAKRGMMEYNPWQKRRTWPGIKFDISWTWSTSIKSEAEHPIALVIYLIIYVLLKNDIVGSTYFIVSNVDDQWITKGRGWEGMCPNMRRYLVIFLQGLKKTTKELHRKSRSEGRSEDPGPLEHEGIVLTFLLRRSVVSLVDVLKVIK